MKKYLNEIEKLQKIAGILKENTKDGMNPSNTEFIIQNNSFIKDRNIADKYLPVGTKFKVIEEEDPELEDPEFASMIEIDNYEIVFDNGTEVEIGESLLGDGYQVSIMNADPKDAKKHDTYCEVPLYNNLFKSAKTAKNRFLKDLQKK